MGLIADLIRAGVAPELVEQAAEQMAEERARGVSQGLPLRSKSAERQARYRERKASQTVTNRNGVTEVTENVTSVTQSEPPHARVVILDLPSEDICKNPPLVPPPVETAPRAASRAKPRRKIDPNAQPTDRDRQAAGEAGMDGETFRAQWRQFRDHHTAKGSLMADWSAAWRTWCGNFQTRFSPSARSRPPPGEQASPLIRAARNLMRDIHEQPTDRDNVIEIIPAGPGPSAHGRGDREDVELFGSGGPFAGDPRSRSAK